MERKLTPEDVSGAPRARSFWPGSSTDKKPQPPLHSSMETARAVRERIQMSRNQHDEAAEYFRHLYFLLAVPSVILAASSGVVEAIFPNGGEWRKMAIAVVSAANTCVLTVSNMYGFQSVKDQHLQAAKMYYALLQDFDYTVWFPGQKAEDLMEELLSTYLERVEKKLAELGGQVPPIPLWILRQAQAQGQRAVAVNGARRSRQLDALSGFVDYAPLLGGASVAAWDLLRGIGCAHAYAMAAFVVQAVVGVAVKAQLGSGWPEGDEQRGPCCRVFGAVYEMLFGLHGLAAAAMVTWSFYYLFRGDLWQLTYIVPQALSTLLHACCRTPAESQPTRYYAPMEARPADCRKCLSRGWPGAGGTLDQKVRGPTLLAAHAGSPAHAGTDVEAN